MKNSRWFKVKISGWGWYPGTWQGWLIVGLYIVVVSLDMYLFREFMSNSAQFMFFMVRVAVYTLLLGVICYIKGEPQRLINKQ